jgi:carbon monoxide dehydrogenase subunit G
MDLTHRFRVPASVEETWTAFNHLDRLAPCFPGATLSGTDGDRFQGSIKIKIGPLALVYDGSGQVAERNEISRRLVFRAAGTDRRGNGTATATVTASLDRDGSGTKVKLVTELDFTGRPEQFGSGVVADVTDKLVDQFASCVAGRFADGPGSPTAAAASAPRPVADAHWQDWAAGADRTAGAGRAARADPSDEQPTVELAAVGPGSGGSTAIGAATSAEEPVSKPAPVRARTAPPRPFRYTPPSNVAQPDLHVTRDVVSTLLRRYGPLLGFLSLGAVLTVKLVNRFRR